MGTDYKFKKKNQIILKPLPDTIETDTPTYLTAYILYVFIFNWWVSHLEFKLSTDPVPPFHNFPYSYEQSHKWIQASCCWTEMTCSLSGLDFKISCISKILWFIIKNMCVIFVFIPGTELLKHLEFPKWGEQSKCLLLY